MGLSLQTGIIHALGLSSQAYGLNDTSLIELSSSLTFSPLYLTMFLYLLQLMMLVGYYGDPTLGSAIPCRECMCPGGEGSGFQHADTCSLDPRTKDMICDCPDQFAGRLSKAVVCLVYTDSRYGYIL